MEFSEEGVVNTRTFVTKNISMINHFALLKHMSCFAWLKWFSAAKKYYKRELDGEDERKFKEGDKEEEEEESWGDEGWEDDDSDW